MSFHETLHNNGINETDIVEWREAKLHQGGGEDEVNYSGYLLLTQDKLIFVSSGGFMKQSRKRYEVGVFQIHKISKIPMMKQFMIFANTAPQEAGFLKKMFSSKSAHLSVKDPGPFFEKVKEMNPNIKF